MSFAFDRRQLGGAPSPSQDSCEHRFQGSLGRGTCHQVMACAIGARTLAPVCSVVALVVGTASVGQATAEVGYGRPPS